jgi:hypothetical protein
MSGIVGILFIPHLLSPKQQIEPNRIFRTLSKNTVRSSWVVWANLKEGSKKQIYAILGVFDLNKGGNFEKTMRNSETEI